MKRSLLVISLMVAITSVVAREKLAIGGSYCDTIVIIDRQTKAVEWKYALPYKASDGGECNSVAVNNDGNVLLSYKKGARLVDRNGQTIWDFCRENDNQEVQTAIITNNGYMLGICGRPARFIFLDKRGNKISETSYDTGIEDIHAQFRQARLTNSGNIMIPMIGAAKVVEIDKKGNKINEFQVGAAPFSVQELNNNKVLVSGGNGVKEYSLTNGLINKTIAEDSITGMKLEFPTQSIRLKNGNTIITNWQGHAKNNQPQIAEIDNNGNVVWMFDNKKAVKYVSAVCLFDDRN